MISASPRGIDLPEAPEPLPRLLRNTLWIGFVLCCAVPVGCQKSLLQNVQQAKVTIPLQEKVSREFPQELEGLHVYLSQDLWVRNHNWAPFQEWKTLQEHKNQSVLSSIDVHRWVFGSLKENQLLAESSVTKTAEPSPEIPKSELENATTEKEKPLQNPQTEPNQLSDKTNVPHENWSFDSLQDFLVRTGFPDSKSKASSTQPLGKIAALKQLSKWDSLSGWNAAILWASLDPENALDAIPILEKIVFEQLEYDRLAADTIPESNTREIFQSWKKETPKTTPEMTLVSSAMKHAAINGICLVLSRADAMPLTTKNRLTKLLQRPDISIEQRGELYRGLARFMPPVAIPSLEQSLNVSDGKTLPPKILRRAAMDACLIHGLGFYREQNQISDRDPSLIPSQKYEASVWPANIMQVRWDSDAVLRWNFGLWAALVRHPETEAILTSQLRDSDLLVQNKAIEHLGILGTEQALELLQTQSKRLQESSRVSAAIGLTPWGVHYLALLKDDASSSVRSTVAEGLSQTVSVESALLLRSLINDRSSEVQLTVIHSVSQWPDDLAVPLLLEGIQEGTYKTRRKSIMQLINRTGSGGSISIEAPKAERIDAVRELVRTEQIPGGLWNKLMKQGIQTENEVNTSRVAEIQAYFHEVINQSRNSTPYHQAYQELSHLSGKELRVLEKLILETSIQIPSEIYSDLLPKLDPSYAALQELTSTHISDRRKAAQQLLNNSQNVSLSPIIVKRLRKLMTHEQDRLVWRIVMAAIAKDNYEETAQLALLAINHTWPDIRILGCVYFGSHGSPQYATWLLPLLQDKNESVKLAAINAIGHCHNPIAIEGIMKSAPDQSPGPSLRSLMTHSNQRIRFETVAALSRLGDVEGMQEMVRLTSDRLNSTRIDAVREMGDSGQTRFVEPLVQ
uniref:HEAT repeat domain-containing protein n=1 Tax=uncultured Gimesia sp. TaxID=1678688 RepID=UPI00261560C3